MTQHSIDFIPTCCLLLVAYVEVAHIGRTSDGEARVEESLPGFRPPEQRWQKGFADDRACGKIR